MTIQLKDKEVTEERIGHEPTMKFEEETF